MSGNTPHASIGMYEEMRNRLVSSDIANWTDAETGETWQIAKVSNASSVSLFETVNVTRGDSVDAAERLHLGHLVICLPFSGEIDVKAAAAAPLAVQHLNEMRNGVVLNDEVVRRSPSVEEPQGIGGGGDKKKECGIRWTFEFQNTKRSPIDTSRVLLQDVIARKRSRPGVPPPTAIVGTVRSSVTESVATVASVKDIPFLSHSVVTDTSFEIMKDTQYLTYGKVVPSPEATALAAATYLQQLTHHHFGNVTRCHVAMLHGQGSAGTSLRIAFSRVAAQRDMGVRWSSYESAPGAIAAPCGDKASCIRRALQKLKDTQYNYFLVYIPRSDFDMVMKVAMEYQIAGNPDKFLLFVEVPRNFARKSLEKGSPLVDAIQGVGVLRFGASPVALSGRREMRNLSNMWRSTLSQQDFYDSLIAKIEAVAPKKSRDQQQQITMGGSEHEQHNDEEWSSFTPNSSGVLLYEAIVTLGLAACDLQEKTGGVQFTGVELMDAMLRMELEGATGRLEFCPETGARRASSVRYTVANVVSNGVDEYGMVTFREVITSELTLETTPEGRNASIPCKDEVQYLSGNWTHRFGSPRFIYAGYRPDPPHPLPPIQWSRKGISKPMLAVGWTLCMVQILMSIGFGSWVVRYRNLHVVRASQPAFLLPICAGTLLMAFSMIPLAFQESSDRPQWQLDAACMSCWSLYSVGFVLTFSSLYAKTLRLNKIMDPSYVRVTVTARDVCLPVGTFVGVEILLMVLWFVVNPLQSVRMEGDKTDAFGRKTEYYLVCRSDPDGPPFIGLAFLSFVVVLAMAMLELYKARKINTLFAETKYIGLVLLSIVEAYALTAPVLSGPGVTPERRFISLCIIIFANGSSTLLLLFVPKMMVAWKMRGVRVRRRSSWYLGDGNSMTVSMNASTARCVDRSRGQTAGDCHAVVPQRISFQ